MDRDQILGSLRERIVAYAASRIGKDRAEDIAQETLMVLEEKYGHVGSLEELVPLTFRIVRLKLMGLHRKSRRRGEYSQVPVDELPLAAEEDNPAEAFERQEMRERLREALGRLESRCRDLFRLKLEGRSFSEIQKILGASSINTVYTWDSRCRKRLLELMGGRWEKEK